MAEGTKLTAKTPEAKKENSASQIKKTNSSPSISSSVDHILFLQRTVGNQAVEKLLKSGVIQAKLTIGQPGDIYEQEADRIAEQVMRMPDSGTTERKGVSEYNKSPSVQRVCAECEEELQRQTQDSELGYLEFGHSTEDGLHRRKEGIQIQRMCTECEEELQRQPMEEEEEELIQTKLTSSDHPRLQRQEDLEEEEEILQAKQVTGETPELLVRLPRSPQSWGLKSAASGAVASLCLNLYALSSNRAWGWISASCVSTPIFGPPRPRERSELAPLPLATTSSLGLANTSLGRARVGT